MATAQRWDKRAYREICEVSGGGTDLCVTFADGDVLVVPIAKVLPNRGVPDWSSISHDAYAITLTTSQGTFEIPWDRIRILTDANYSAHFASIAEDQARMIGLRIRELRKQRGLSSTEVANRAGISRQSLSRIENGRHDVVFTTLRKILATMGCSLRDLTAYEATSVDLVKAAERAGVPRTFILEQITGTDDLNASGVRAALQTAFSGIFSWSQESLLSGNVRLGHPVLTQALLKQPRSAQQKTLAVQLIYAHWLSVRICDALHNPGPCLPLPETGNELNAELRRRGGVDFRSLLEFSWSHGVVVLPLNIKGGFHGACWKVGHRPIVCLNQGTRFPAWWLFDLGHELGHVRRHLDDSSAIVDKEQISPLNGTDEREDQANEYAGGVVFAGRQEELIKLCVELASGRVEQFKSVVPRVAKAEGVPCDALANYLAFRLARQDFNWWGAATNLQLRDPDPLALARSAIVERLEFDRLPEEERSIVALALGEVP